MTHTNAIWSTTLRGVALGDAWGNPNEFRRINDLTRDDRRGPELPEFLEVTDDTQMTLYLAQALNATAGADVTTTQAAIIANYIAYHDKSLATLDAMHIGRLHCLTDSWDDCSVRFVQSGGFSVSQKVGQAVTPSFFFKCLHIIY
jgi:ADP-ribosylglycohydrolase